MNSVWSNVKEIQMQLWLCEKPSQAKDIAGVLGIRSRGDGQIVTARGTVTWCFGHLVETAQPHEYDPRFKAWSLDTLPIIPTTWKLVIKREAAHQATVIRSLLRQATEVVIATDADREGEMIARELLDLFGYRGSVKRLWLGALDPESIRKAQARLRDGRETEPLYHAALARSRADWLAGMNLTRAATVLARGSGGRDGGGPLSVGRVQTPTLRLVVQRDREIEGFVSRTFYEVVADVATDQGMVQLRHAPPETERIWDKAEAERLATQATGARGQLRVTTERRRQSPPKLFSLSTLQKSCSKQLGWPASKTLKIAQALYEDHKLTSYPRTDCNCLPSEQQVDIPVILANLGSVAELHTTVAGIHQPVLRNNVWDTKAVTAHHAIVPTTVRPELDKLRPDEKQAYLLIARHYLAALMPDAEFDHTIIQMDANGVPLRASGKRLRVSGWRQVLGERIDDEDEPESRSKLLELPDGIAGQVQAAHLDARQTTPPDRYTEGTLIEDMKAVAKYATDPAIKVRLKETSGIGTEATRAEVIETLKARDYVNTKGKQLISTERGRSLIDALPPQVSDPALTGLWEDQLERITTGAVTEPQFTAQAAQWVTTMLKRMVEKGITVTAGTTKPGATSKRKVSTSSSPATRARPKPSRQSPPTPKMLEAANRIAERLKQALPQDVRQDFDACRAWLDQHQQANGHGTPPSAKALAYAETLARRFQMEVPAEARQSARACAAFIDARKA